MANIVPFKALRPQPQHAKQVASKPYDVLSSAEARKEAQGKIDGPALKLWITDLAVGNNVSEYFVREQR